MGYDIWWKLTGKPAVDSYIAGRRLQDYSDEEILEMMKGSINKFGSRQMAYAGKKLSITKDKFCSKCGKCCMGFHIQITALTSDLKRYFSYHEKVEVEETNGKTYLYIKNRCIHLSEGNLCLIHETKPFACQESYTKIRDRSVNFPDGCTLK